jgi:hypothetical protein
MTSPQTAVPQTRAIRLIHASMVASVVIFVLVGHFALRSSMHLAQFRANVIAIFLCLALVGCGVAGFLRGRVPRRSNDESADAFWIRAAAPTIVFWAAAEGPSLFGVAIYLVTGSRLGLGIAGLGVLILLLGNPASLERR